MTVKELIEKLTMMPQDVDVKFSYRYDGIETIESDVDIVEFDYVDVILKRG